MKGFNPIWKQHTTTTTIKFLMMCETYAKSYLTLKLQILGWIKSKFSLHLRWKKKNATILQLMLRFQMLVWYMCFSFQVLPLFFTCFNGCTCYFEYWLCHFVTYWMWFMWWHLFYKETFNLSIMKICPMDNLLQRWHPWSM